MRRFQVVVTILCMLMIPIAAESVGSTSLTLSGIVAPKSLFELAGLFDLPLDAIRLDEGDVLPAGGFGIEVGQWSVSSNSSSPLVLRLNHPNEFAITSGSMEIGTFNATIETEVYRIPYRVSNGSEWIYDGQVFKTLVRNGGTYPSDLNNGPIYIQRIDSDSYPPYQEYQTTIQLVLEAL